MHVDVWVIGGGFECQPFSSVSTRRTAPHSDPRSDLCSYIPIVVDMFTSVFPDAQNFQFAENVASMPKATRAHISDVLALPCYSICPSALSPARRPRLYWFDWALAPASDFSVSVDNSRLRSVTFVPPSHFPDPSSWVEPGWAPVAGPSAIFPTFTTPNFRGVPSASPAGIQRSSESAISRWHADACRFPPFQYESSFGLIFNGLSSTWRVPSVRERQLLLNFRQFHTECCMSSAHAASSPAEFELEQLRLLGNSFHCGVVSWILGHLFFRLGVLPHPPPASIISPIVPVPPSLPSSGQASLELRVIRKPIGVTMSV